MKPSKFWITMSAYQKVKEDFLKRIEEHPKLSQNKGEIFTAFSFGEEKHRGKNRKHSNEPYFIHPTSVASSLLSEQDVEKDFIIAALLHDTVEDTETTLDEIDNNFGNTVKLIVKGLTKLPDSYKNSMGPDKYYQEGFFGPILSAAKTIPFVWKIKLADRLNNLETLWQYASKQKMDEYLWETQQLFKLSIGVKTPLKDQIRKQLKEHYQFKDN